MLPVWGWDLRSSGLLISGIILLRCFVRHEMNLSRDGRTPLFDLAILRNGQFVTGTGVVVCVYATSSAFPLVLSLLLQNVMGATPLEAGLIFVPSGIGFVIASFIMPRVMIKRGEHVIFRGALWYAAGYLALIAGFHLLPAGETAWFLTPLLFWVGFTQGMIMTPMLNLVLSRVPAPETGMASGLTATLQQIGAAAGATAVSVILQFSLRSSDGSAIISGRVSAFSLSLGFNILMALCAAWFLYRLMRNSCVSGE